MIQTRSVADMKITTLNKLKIQHTFEKNFPFNLNFVSIFILYIKIYYKYLKKISRFILI